MPIIFLFMFAFSAQASPVLSVNGHCQREVTPDRVVLNLGVVKQSKDPAEAIRLASEQYESLRAEVRKLELKDLQLQTAQMSVTPEWGESQRKPTIKSYTARARLRIETSELQRIGEALTVSSRVGVHEVMTPQPFLSRALRESEYEQCLEVAIQNARAKATRMAQASGSSLAEINSIDESSGNETYMPPESFLMSKARQESSSFEVKPELVTSSVLVKFNLH